jgi:hypothetical protein
VFCLENTACVNIKYWYYVKKVLFTIKEVFEVMAKRMIDVGVDLISEMLKDIPLGKNEIGRMIGLSQGGFWRVTCVSGRMNEAQWETLQEIYFKYSKKKQLPKVTPASQPDLLKTIELDALVDEIESRGWKVSIARRTDRT